MALDCHACYVQKMLATLGDKSALAAISAAAYSRLWQGCCALYGQPPASVRCCILDQHGQDTAKDVCSLALGQSCFKATWLILCCELYVL